MEGEETIVYHDFDDLCDLCDGEGTVPCPKDCDETGIIYCNTCDSSGVVTCPRCKGSRRDPMRSGYREGYEMLCRPMGFVERLSIQTEKLRAILATQGRTGIAAPTSRTRTYDRSNRK